MDASLGVLRRVARATVTLDAEIPESHPSVPVLGTQRFGSGAVVDEQGHILTVTYVVLGAESVRVTDIDGHCYDGNLVAQDFLTGVAVVAMEGGHIAPLDAGTSESLSTGEDVFMVASVGEAERRCGSGFVCSLDPFDAYWEYYLERGIWTSSINPGLGGAALCNRRGELVGVASLNLGSVGRAALSVPAEHYFDHSAELLANGRRISRRGRAWLGMFCYAFPDRTVVAGVIPGAPAEAGGLSVGDVIIRIDEIQVTGRLQLYKELWKRRPGEAVQLKVFRAGQLSDVTVNTGDAEEFFAPPM